MIPRDPYRWLMEGSTGRPRDSFDAHVVASIVALALFESRAEGRTLLEGVGLDEADFLRMIENLFAHAALPLAELAKGSAPSVAEEEACLRDLLERCSTKRSAFEKLLAAMVARRALRPNHLWQDLGLRDRDELSRLMDRHFKPIAVRNARDMKWKKFLYRTICRDEGYTLCTAPSCSECGDFHRCFGEESGESLLAAVRRAAEAGA